MPAASEYVWEPIRNRAEFPLCGARPLDLAGHLRVAIGLASSLGHARQRGLIHKDVRPGNVLVDDGHVWLARFAIAFRPPRERQAQAPPAIVAGALAYMSPERTGRMNRSMDAGSDLYSLGVTLYQMLTGVLPFAAGDVWNGSIATSHVSRYRPRMAVAWPHRFFPLGCGRLVRPIVDTREAVREGTRGKCSSGRAWHGRASKSVAHHLAFANRR
jgi:serine/threonine protein kinase